MAIIKNPILSVELQSNEKEKSILDKISIDLPSGEDVKILFDAYSDRYGDKKYKYNITTDMAKLCGERGILHEWYLKDANEIDQYFISHVVDSYTNICFNDCDMYKPYSHDFLLRPVLDFKNCPELFDRIQYFDPIGEKNSGKVKYARTYFGLYPRYVVSQGIENKLNIEFKHHNITKTNDVYTFDKTYPHIINNFKKSFNPIESPVYEYEGKKYIRWKICQLLKDTNVELSNNIRYYNGKHVWIEITPIPWIIDFERKVLIAQEGLLYGIPFESFRKKFNPIDYQSSFIKNFLDNTLKKEMLNNEPLLKNKKESVKKESKPEKKDEVSTILDSIRIYKKYYLGNMDVETKVKNILTNYQNDLKNISTNIGSKNKELSIGIQSPKLLYQKLLLNLNDVLFELKTHGEKVKNYYDMIDILLECKKDEIDTSKDELCGDVNTIKHVSINFVANEQLRKKLQEKLEKIINKNIKRNKSYIEEFKTNDNIKAKSLDELKLEFRRDLQPFLEKELITAVEKQNLVNEIMNNVKLMIENHFTESKNKVVKNYLTILNEIILKIKENGTSDDIELLKNIVNVDFNIDDDINITHKLELMIIEAYKIELDILERDMINREINDLKLDFDTESIFDENHTK